VLRGAGEGLSAVIAHPTAVFGPGDWKHNLLPLFRAAKRGTALAVPRGIRTTCDVRDVARAHLALAERGRPGERYILGGESLSVRDLMTRIARVVGGRRPLFTLPDAAILRVGALMDAVAEATGRPPVLSREMALQSTFTARLSSDKAAREIGYASRPLGESLRDAAAWYRARGLM
jgi:dihydroflavonol-4-reductase